jgi:hypothetical protein
MCDHPSSGPDLQFLAKLTLVNCLVLFGLGFKGMPEIVELRGTEHGGQASSSIDPKFWS